MTVQRRWIVLAAALVAAPWIAAAQPSHKRPRVALVHPIVTLADMRGPQPADPVTYAFVERLRQLGYIDGRNISIELRSAERQPERLDEIMKELVDSRVDVIVAIATAATAARRATSTIPIVAYANDPIAGGLTSSLSRPTQNVTGVMLVSAESIVAKSLGLLKQAAPASRRVAVIDFKYVDAKMTPGTHYRRVVAQAAARDLGITLFAVGANSDDDVEEALALIDSQRADALLVIGTTVTVANRGRIIDFARERRLPAMYSCRTCVEEGGLMSYGAPESGLPERLADYVDKLLKGARPADLPFEQPNRYELVINAKTAARLGLSIPNALRLTADLVE